MDWVPNARQPRRFQQFRLRKEDPERLIRNGGKAKRLFTWRSPKGVVEEQQQSGSRMETVELRAQHDLLGQLATELLDQIERGRQEIDVLRVAQLLAKLNGLLRVHFAQEDCLLYPAMIAGGDPEAAHLAYRYHQEMGGLAQQFEAYMRSWSVSATIGVAFEAFCADTRSIVGALDARIECENEILYPVADRLFALLAAA